MCDSCVQFYDICQFLLIYVIMSCCAIYCYSILCCIISVLISIYAMVIKPGIFIVERMIHESWSQYWREMHLMLTM